MGIPCPGMDGHARRFINGDDVIIFVKNAEGNRFGFGLERRSRLCVNLDDVAIANFLCALGGFAVHEDEGLLDEFLNAGAREIGAVSGNDAVEALASVRVGHGEGELGSVGHVESVAREGEGMVGEGRQNRKSKVERGKARLTQRRGGRRERGATEDPRAQPEMAVPRWRSKRLGVRTASEEDVDD